MELALLSCPLVLTLAIRLAVQVVTNIFIAILKGFVTVAVLQEVIEVALILRLFGLESTVAMDDAHSPVATVHQVLADDHSAAVLQPIHKGSLVRRELGDLQSHSITLIIRIVPVVPAAIGLHEQPFTLPQIILESALIEPPVLKQHNSGAMAHPVEGLTHVDFIAGDLAHLEGPCIDQFGVVGAVPD